MPSNVTLVVPASNPCNFPLTIASIIGLNLGSCETPFGITASPGVSMAGTVSLFPVPGTSVTPLANFLGVNFPPGIIIPGFALAKFVAAIVASI